MPNYNQCTWLVPYYHEDMLEIFQREHLMMTQLLMNMFFTLVYPRLEEPCVFYLKRHNMTVDYYIRAASKCMLIHVDDDD